MVFNKVLIDAFRGAFARAPRVVARAPGRVNLIGEHVDYNGGFVLPVAIDRQVGMGAAFRPDRKLVLYSADFSQRAEVDLARALERTGAEWVNYFLAVAHQFSHRGFNVPAVDVLIMGDVPVGAGLSSSAAFCVCAAILIDNLAGTNLPPREIALLAQAAEQSDFVGVQCGIMDQFISVLGEEDHALLIDCHALDYEQVPFDSDAATILIINSMKKRQLVSSEYNKRRVECETGLLRLRALAGEDFPTLRHVSMETFLRYESGIWGAPRRRLRHNITENRRVLDFAAALRQGDFVTAGQLLNQSHASLRDDFEVSCPELDAIVEIANTCGGVFGARMTGAGFGGCAIALAAPDSAGAAAERVRLEYKARFEIDAEFLTSPPCMGADLQVVRESVA